MESTTSLPLTSIYSDSSLPPGAAASAIDGRATSFSGSSRARPDVVVGRSGSAGHSVSRVGPLSSYSYASGSQQNISGNLARNSSTLRAVQLKALPHVYPALLSRVADAFKQLIELDELVKDDISYKDSFDGRTAVGVIADIIRTPDRNLALLLGRALDSQKFFHDVTYYHRLRDTANEIYQFKERLSAPFMQDGVQDSPTSEHVGMVSRMSSSTSTSGIRGLTRPPNHPYPSETGSIQTSDSHMSFSTSNTPVHSTINLPHNASSPNIMTDNNGMGLVAAGEADSDDEDLPMGVFTLLTDCYSPTCSRDSLCYSINCPRRLEQMKRLNMKPNPGLTRKLSTESLGEVKVCYSRHVGLWLISSRKRELCGSTPSPKTSLIV
jgi:hypothetical protein